MRPCRGRTYLAPGEAITHALTVRQEKALGLTFGSTPFNDYVVLNSSVVWTFDPNNRLVRGEYDAIGAIKHEISEECVLKSLILPISLLSAAELGYSGLMVGDIVRVKRRPGRD